MNRNWVYDETIRKALAYARRLKLDLGTEVADIPLAHIESERSVVTDPSIVTAIREAKAFGLTWPEDMPLVILACEPRRCITIDGNHRIKAARAAGVAEIPAIIVRLSTWDALLPKLSQPDVIPYDDFIAVLAEAGSEDIRRNLNLEAERLGE